MSRGFIKEGDQEEIPMVPPRAHLPKGMPNYVTREGLEALNKEREDLENERVAASGNYIMSNFIDAKMKLLIDRINTAVEVDMTKANKETVSFGAYVKYNGRTVRIVGVDEADFSKGLLSFISPVAKALVGRKVGEKFEIKIPKGTESIEIQGIWYERQELTSQETLHLDGISRCARNDKGDGVKTFNSNEIPRLPTVARNDSSVNVISTEAERSGEISNKIDVFAPEENIMEFLPVVNERGIIVGRALQMELHKGNKILHPAVHLHVINNKGEAVWKNWGHLAFGDAPGKNPKRKNTDNLGISGVKPEMKRQNIRENKTGKELVYGFFLNSEENLLKNPEVKEYFDIFAKD
ncbi:MAG: hypothetical protein CW336_09250 [Bacteroidetes bacterium]|nr:hypothetical protein [Bacteroidota bacterium]